MEPGELYPSLLPTLATYVDRDKTFDEPPVHFAVFLAQSRFQAACFALILVYGTFFHVFYAISYRLIAMAVQKLTFLYPLRISPLSLRVVCFQNNVRGLV